VSFDHTYDILADLSICRTATACCYFPPHKLFLTRVGDSYLTSIRNTEIIN